MIKARITNLEKGNSVAYEGEILELDKRYGTTLHIVIRVDQHLQCVFDDIDEKDITIIQNGEKPYREWENRCEYKYCPNCGALMDQEVEE